PLHSPDSAWSSVELPVTGTGRGTVEQASAPHATTIQIHIGRIVPPLVIHSSSESQGADDVGRELAFVGVPEQPRFMVNVSTLSPRAEQRLAGIARVMWIILGLNLIVALAKLLYGYRSGAIAITADGIHSLLDSASNVIGLIGISVAGRPADSNHPYGHRKYETFAALGVAMM